MFARAFLISWIGYFGFYLCRKNFSVLMPYLKSELGQTSGDLANAVFFYSVSYALGQFAMGRLVDRVGARWVTGLGMLASAGLSTLTALPAMLSFAPFAIILILIQAGNGAAQSTGWPGVLKLSLDWFPVANRGVWMSWWGTHLVLGGFAGTWLAASCAEVHWTRAAIVPAFVLTGIAAAFLLVARDRPHEPASAQQPDNPVRRLRITPALIAIAAMYFCVKMTRYSFLFWLPLYMTEHLGYTKPHAGYASSIYELIGILGAIFAGYVSERMRAERHRHQPEAARFQVGALMMATLAVLCATYPAASAAGLITNLLWIGLIGFCTFGPDTLMAGSALQDIVPRENIGAAGGFVNGVGSVGQVLSQFVVAYVSQHAGWPALFGGLAVVVLCGSAALFTQWTSRRQEVAIT